MLEIVILGRNHLLNAMWGSIPKNKHQHISPYTCILSKVSPSSRINEIVPGIASASLCRHELQVCLIFGLQYQSTLPNAQVRASVISELMDYEGEYQDSRPEGQVCDTNFASKYDIGGASK